MYRVRPTTLLVQPYAVNALHRARRVYLRRETKLMYRASLKMSKFQKIAKFLKTISIKVLNLYDGLYWSNLL
jgi:hypothetical protein